MLTVESSKLLLVPFSLNGGCCSDKGEEFVWNSEDGETTLVTDDEDEDTASGCVATSAAASGSLNTVN